MSHTNPDDSGPIETPKRRASDHNPQRSGPSGWLTFGVAVIGITAGGLGSLAASSYGRGEQAAQLEAVRIKVEAHDRIVERLAVVEANVQAIREGVARVESAMRDERAERRAGGKQ